MAPSRVINLRLTDRSRIVTYRRCPRRRWWEYEYKGRGVVPRSTDLALTVGLAVHEGIHQLLVLSPTDMAVRFATEFFQRQAENRGIHTEGGVLDIEEQVAMVEGLVRLFALEVLPGLTDEFEILETERELALPLTVAGDSLDLRLMSRPDAGLRQRSTGDYYIGSWKTTGSHWSARMEAEARHDDQGIAELLAFENDLLERRTSAKSVALRQRENFQDILRQPDPDLTVLQAKFTELLDSEKHCRALALTPTDVVMGVQMIYLLKGDRREWPEDSGQWVQWSPLVRGWRRPIAAVGSESAWEYAWSYRWECVAQHINGQGRRCPGGVGHRLGKGWEPFSVWQSAEVGGVKGWLDMLEAGVVQPDAGPCLSRQIVRPAPYFRVADEVQDWWAQARAQENAIADSSSILNQAIHDGNSSRVRYDLNNLFAQHRQSCLWPSRCPYYETLCWGPVPDYQVRPEDDAEAWRWREPHHQPEHEITGHGCLG